MFPTARIAGGALVALAAALPTTPAAAATVEMLDYQSAPAICQPARPDLLQPLRFRPLGIDNEGTAGAFLTCALQTSDRWDGVAPTKRVGLRFVNRGATPASVNCTFVYGALPLPDGVPRYYPSTKVVDAGGDAFFDVYPADLEESQIRFAQWSCALPPQVTLAYGIRVYEINVAE